VGAVVGHALARLGFGKALATLGLARWHLPFLTVCSIATCLTVCVTVWWLVSWLAVWYVGGGVEAVVPGIFLLPTCVSLALHAQGSCSTS
jgi:hypothetical protein